MQWTYDAYGDCLSATSPTATPLTADVPTMHAGHKGLFIDRLDAGITDQASGMATDRLVPNADILYQNRNRTYAPRLGRFMQADPNASGQTVQDTLDFWANKPVANVPAFDLGSRMEDGLGLYQYCRSNSSRHSDPTGLFVGDAINAYGTIGVTAALLAGMLISEYADNLDHDVEWATDWSLPDDWHSRSDNSWIKAIYDSVNINETVDEYVDFGGVPIDTMVASVAGTATKTLKAFRRAGRVLLKGQLHHALPKYLARIMGRGSNVLVRVPKHLHQDYHNFVSRGMNSKLGCPFMNAPRAKWTDWIARQKRLGKSEAQIHKEIRASLESHTRVFEGKHGITGLSDALQQAW